MFSFLFFAMKKTMSRVEARRRIGEFFQREDFRAEEVRKIKRLAMKYRVPLREYRRLFCKQCFSRLRGKTRVNWKDKTIVCGICGYLNRFLIRRE